MLKQFVAPGGFCYLRRDDGLYEAQQAKLVYIPRYDKTIFIKLYQVRDGATWAKDLRSISWWAHDQLCADGHWNDGTDVTPLQAAFVLYDILREEGYWFRARTWFVFTLILGCRKAHGDHSHVT